MRYETTIDHPDDEVNFAEVLQTLWAEGSLSLSGAVWWIATGGEPDHCYDDEALELATKALIRAALDGRVTIYGQNKAGGTLPIALETFGKTLNVATFTGADEDFLLFFKGAALRWRLDLTDEVFSDEKGDGDTIEDRDIVLWRRMFVRMIDIERIWPRANACYVTANAESSVAENDPLPRQPKRRTKSVKMKEFMRARFDHDPGYSCRQWREYFARNNLPGFDMANADTILSAALMAWRNRPPK